MAELKLLGPGDDAFRGGYNLRMTADSLWQRLRRKPFVPFRLYLSGGTYYDIHHPEMMLVTRSGITVALYDAGQSAQEPAARESLVSFLHVTSTEDLPIPSRVAG